MKVIRFLDKWLEEIIIASFMGYFVFAIVIEVIARLLKVSAPWTEETARYAFIWMTLVGSAVAAKRGLHVRVDILEIYAPKKLKPVIHWICMFLFLVFTVILFVVGLQVCMNVVKNPQKTAVLKISTVWVYAALPVGMFLTSFRLIQNMVRAFLESRKAKEGT